MQNKNKDRAGMSARSIIIKAVSFIVMALSFVYIYITFSKIDTEVLRGRISPLWIAGIIFLTMLYLLVNLQRAYNWKCILEFLISKPIEGYAVSGIYLRTEIAKYIPSNMVHFAGRHLLTRKMGISDKALVAANILDMGFLLGTASFVVALTLFSGQLPLPDAVMKYIHLKILFIAMVGFFTLSAVLFLVKGKKLIEIVKPYLTLKKVLRAFVIAAMYIPVFVLSSVILLAVLHFMCGADITLSAAVKVFASFTFAWTLGFIVPGAPGGLGVRESVLIILLAPVFGSTASLTAALISRVISILGDLSAFALSHIRVFRY